MNFELSPACVVFFFVLAFCTQTSLQEDSKKKRGPGPTGCGYFGNLENSCNKTSVKCDLLPNGCSSFFYDGIVVDSKYHVKNYWSKEDEMGYDELLKCSSEKNVYVFYGYAVEQFWTHVLGCNGCNGVNAVDEMVGLKAYLDEHPGAAGLVLCGLEFNTITNRPFPSFTENLCTYIKVMKSTFPDMEVAMSFSGRYIIDQFTGPQDRKWLDLKVLSEVLDFFVVIMTCFNDCTEEFRLTGTVPLSGNANYTLEKLTCILSEQNIPQEKLYYLFGSSPTASSSSMDASVCTTTYAQICTNKTSTCEWCADSSTTLYKKGQFIKNKANGFILGNVDFDYNTEGCCGCKTPYPTFQYMVNGYNGVQSECCSLYDTR